MEITKGTLLISTSLEKGLFARSVILLCEHNPSGSFGLIINKPLAMDFPEDLLSIESQENPNIAVLTGGNLQLNQMILVHSSPSVSDQALQLCDGVYLGGNLEFLQKEMSDSNGPHIRLCFGYTAWGPGGLEKEVLSSAWFLHPGRSELVFQTPSSSIWASILKEMGGKYASLSMIPEDLSLN